MVLKHLLLFTLGLLLHVTTAAQNLVANGSFEDENICTEFGKNCSPEGWIISSLQSHFYFDESPNAYQGKHYVGLVAGMNGRYGSRNFISSQLLCGLRKDAWYNVVFYLLPGTEMTDSVGVFFSTDDLMYRKFGLKGVTPSFFVTDVEVTGKGGWRRYAGRFKASGGEAFISIGLFKKTAPERISGAISNPKYYCFVDSVSVLPVDIREQLCADAAAAKEALYNRNERHSLLEKATYLLQRKPPVEVQLTRTSIVRIDTLVIPDVLFATNSYALTPGAVQLLDSFTKKLGSKTIDSVVVEGHTDSRGNKAANLTLSKNRAASVGRQLEQGLKTGANMALRGWADEKPVATNNTPEGRQKNRRVVIYLYLRE